MIKKYKRSVNIHDVAREAGVSIKTVSRVLNERPDVAPQTRERVQSIIAQLGYQPNASARSLSSRRTYTLGLISDHYDDTFFQHVIAGAEAEARRRGYQFLLGSTAPDSAGAPSYLRLLKGSHVDGILFVRHGIEEHNADLLRLLQEDVTIATTGYHIPNQALLVVDADNVDGARQATRHLLAHGHRQIAVITGMPRMKATIDRLRGAELALAEVGAALDPALVVEGAWAWESGYQAMRVLLARGRPFSAVFAQNDAMAIGALRALHEAGLRVPGDVSVVGFDDIDVAGYCLPPLTTVRQPIVEIGTVAARLLIQSIEGQPPAQNITLLPTTLVCRQSVGPPR